MSTAGPSSYVTQAMGDAGSVMPNSDHATPLALGPGLAGFDHGKREVLFLAGVLFGSLPTVPPVLSGRDGIPVRCNSQLNPSPLHVMLELSTLRTHERSNGSREPSLQDCGGGMRSPWAWRGSKQGVRPGHISRYISMRCWLPAWRQFCADATTFCSCARLGLGH